MSSSTTAIVPAEIPPAIKRALKALVETSLQVSQLKTTPSVGEQTRPVNDRYLVDKKDIV